MIPSSGPYRAKRHAVAINPVLVYFFKLFILFCTFILIPASSRSLVADEEIAAIGLIFDVYDIGIVRR
jgi:positive regulator of sigma E activity